MDLTIEKDNIKLCKSRKNWIIPSAVLELETTDCSALLAQLLGNNLLVFGGDSRDKKEVEIEIIKKYFLEFVLFVVSYLEKKPASKFEAYRKDADFVFMTPGQ